MGRYNSLRLGSWTRKKNFKDTARRTNTFLALFGDSDVRPLMLFGQNHVYDLFIISQLVLLQTLFKNKTILIVIEQCCSMCVAVSLIKVQSSKN